MIQKGGWIVSRECGMWNMKDAENPCSRLKSSMPFKHDLAL
jgi:hypothetical protein